jgi:hypothetical protein
MNKTTFALCIALVLSTLTGCSGTLVSFSYKVVDPPSGPRYLTTHCVSSNNCKTLYTNPDGSVTK